MQKWPIILLALVAIIHVRSLYAVVIDDFQVNQSLAANVGTQDVNASMTGPAVNILGTERDLRINKVGSSVSTVNIVFGTFLASMGANSSGTITMQWDATLDATKNNIDDDGLAFVDLTDGGYSDSIAVWAGNGLAPVTATMTVWADDQTNTSTIVPSTNTLIIPPSFNNTTYFHYEDFLTPVDFSKVAALQLELVIPQGGTIDLQLLESVDFFPMAPEPNMLVIAGPLLAGLAWNRRRMRRERLAA